MRFWYLAHPRNWKPVMQRGRRVVSGDLVEALAIERAGGNFRLGWRVYHLDGTGEPLVAEVGEMLSFLAGAAPWVVWVA